MSKDIEILRSLDVDFSTDTGFRIDDGFDDAYDYHRKWGGANNLDSIWSIYGLNVDFDKPCPHPIEGKDLLYTIHWGPETVRVEVEGPTWGDLWIAADKAIRLSGDDHHIYIESVEDLPDGTLTLTTGS